MGYATNLLCLFGSNPCGEEKYNPLIVNDGYSCNDLVYEFIKKHKINRLHIKFHPREIIQSYETFMDGIRNHNIRIMIHSDLNAFLKTQCIHYVCHPSSICLALLKAGKRVYIYNASYLKLDSESTLGELSKHLYFSDVDQLVNLTRMYNDEYWDIVKSALSA